MVGNTSWLGAFGSAMSAHADGLALSSAASPRKARRNVAITAAADPAADGAAAATSAPQGGLSAPGPGSGVTPEVQQAGAKACEEEVMRLSREFQDRWLVVKAYKDEPAAHVGSSLLLQILEGTESEQREALQSIVTRPQPLSRRQPAPPPRIAPAAPPLTPREPEPEPELASGYDGAAALLKSGFGAARDMLSPVVALTAASPVAAPPPPPEPEASPVVSPEGEAKQYWEYNLNEDRNATLGATFWCHVVLAGAEAGSECSAVVFLTEGDSAEIVIVRESAVVGGDEDEGVASQVGRHPLFELCKVVRGDSDQYLRLDFEGDKAYVLLTRDEAATTEILEQLDEAVGMGATAAIDGAQQTRVALCETLREHHTEVDDDEGKDMSEDDILAYFLLFQLDNDAEFDDDDVIVGLADKFCAASGSAREGRPRTFVMSMDWLYLCSEDYAVATRRNPPQLDLSGFS